MQDEHESKNTAEDTQEHIGEQQESAKQAETQEPASTPVSAETAATDTKVAKGSKKKLFVLIGAALAVVLIGAAGFFFFAKDDGTKQSATTPTPTQQTKKEEPAKSAEKIDPLLEKFINPTTGETWLSEPKKIASLGYLKYALPEDVTYYEVGKRGANTIYMSVESVLGDIVYLYEKTADGKVLLIARPDGQATYNEENEKSYADTFTAMVTIDKDTHYDSLTLPLAFDLENGYSAGQPSYYPILGDLVRADTDGALKGSFTTLKTYGGSKLQRYEQKYSDTNLTSIGYSLTLPTHTRLTLSYEPIEPSLKSYQWSKGEYSEDNISAIARGCGNRFATITKSEVITDADVVQVGKSPSGKVVYELKDQNHVLLTKAYQEFHDFAVTAPEVPYATYTKEQFIKAHGLVLHKDKTNQWLVYTRDQLRPQFGCAKPVVYLYPTKAQEVQVRVGADVKVSEPLYNPISGWQNVWAEPSGRLTVGGRYYESLFWEGPGYGEYPGITSGTIVPTTEAITTIKQELSQLGLNEKEIADFVEYWQPNLPNKPYIRLTWLQTEELNRLAPLYVQPKPDTVIRVFLDFAGLDNPIAIAPQQLTAKPRTGFTVVEWGGLSLKKLY